MSQPYFGGFDDGEGTASHPVPGFPGETRRDDYLSPWYTPGYTAHLGENGEMVYTDLIPGSSAVNFANFPADQFAFRKVTQRYFSPDGDPLGGFLTFMPSSAFTITEDGVSYRIPRRLAGTETYPALDSGVSPWAFSMEGSGRIYVWLGLMVVKLYPTDSPNVTTDDGNPLTYHVTEHFIGGRQFDITVPSGDTALDLYSSIVPGSNRPYDYDPVFPMGSLLGTDLWPSDRQCVSVTASVAWNVTP